MGFSDSLVKAELLARTTDFQTFNHKKMATRKYKAIFVKCDTHHELMVEARKSDMTADEFLKFLLEFLKQKNGETITTR